MIYFISGTDTGVGKTVVAAALLQWHLQQGRSAAYYKPVQTGVDAGEVGDRDFVASLCQASQQEAPCIEGLRYPLALAPATAANLANESVPWEQLVAQAEELASRHEVLLVEGAGGLLVPMTESQNMADLCQALDAQLILVCRPGLGSLNHTALSLEAARSRGLQLAGLVVSPWPQPADLAQTTNLQAFRDMAPIIGVLEQSPGLDSASLAGGGSSSPLFWWEGPQDH